MDLVWVTSHIGIPGNEAPEEVANKSLLAQVLLPRVTIKLALRKADLRRVIRDGDQQRG